MQDKNINILSTRPLPDNIISHAALAGINIDIISFIATEPIQTIDILEEIDHVFLQSAVVVFTSMNAVEAVATRLEDQQPDWSIYCIGNTTANLVKKYFGENCIAGTASSAMELGELMLLEIETDEVIFFCGDQRRDELPDLLNNQSVNVQEIVVYQTIPLPQPIEKKYAGILFFSPSAVASFFLKNKLDNQTILFAIGNTTADEIKKFTKNRVIISKEPGKEALTNLMIDFFREI